MQLLTRKKIVGKRESDVRSDVTQTKVGATPLTRLNTLVLI